MRSFKATLSIIIIAPAFAVIVSCTPGSCFEEMDALVKAYFYLDDTGETRSPDSLTIFGVGMDTSRIYSRSARVQPALLPLNADTISCSFVIRLNGINDTLQLRYLSYPHLVSIDCGYTFFHQLEDNLIYTNNIIDTVIIRNKSITTLDVENIRIYY
jgi:hypothetical protein